MKEIIEYKWQNYQNEIKYDNVDDFSRQIINMLIGNQLDEYKTKNVINRNNEKTDIYY